MPNQRQPGTKLAGAYISAEKDKALAELAAQKGFTNKAEFIRGLFDDAIAKNAQALKKPKRLRPQDSTQVSYYVHRCPRRCWRWCLRC